MCLALPLAAAQEKGKAGGGGSQGFSEVLQRPLPPEGLSGEEPQLVRHLDRKVIGGLEVVGHRLQGQYPLMSQEQLEKDLRSDGIVQAARAKQQALLMVRTGAQCWCVPGPPWQWCGWPCPIQGRQ